MGEYNKSLLSVTRYHRDPVHGKNRRSAKSVIGLGPNLLSRIAIANNIIEVPIFSP